MGLNNIQYEVNRLAKLEHGAYPPSPPGHEVPEDGSFGAVYQETPGIIVPWGNFKPDIDFKFNAFGQTRDDSKTEAGRYIKTKATRRVLRVIGQRVVWQAGAVVPKIIPTLKILPMMTL